MSSVTLGFDGRGLSQEQREVCKDNIYYAALLALPPSTQVEVEVSDDEFFETSNTKLLEFEYECYRLIEEVLQEFELEKRLYEFTEAAGNRDQDLCKLLTLIVERLK